MALRLNHMNQLLATLSAQNRGHFRVTMCSRCQAPGKDTRNCKLTLPASFMQQHGDKLNLQDSVLLRSVMSKGPLTVTLHVSKPTKHRSSPETYFGKGWKYFARKNEIEINDELIFHLLGPSEFDVHIFRGDRQIPIPGSHEPLKRSSDSELPPKGSHKPTKRPSDPELPPRIAQNDSRAACTTVVQRNDISQPGEDPLCEAIAKKRKVAGSVDAGGGAVGTPTESPYLMKLRPSELKDVQVLPFQPRQDPGPEMREMPDPEMPKTTQRVAKNSSAETSSGSVHVMTPLLPPVASLPSFIQRLVKFNVQDDAGNTSGARFDIPFSFVTTHNVQLQSPVKLQGTREDSPIRFVTCSYNLFQDSAARSGNPPLSLGWGDFVRENALHEGQQLVFTLISESFFVIREVHEIVVYTI